IAPSDPDRVSVPRAVATGLNLKLMAQPLPYTHRVSVPRADRVPKWAARLGWWMRPATRELMAQTFVCIRVSTTCVSGWVALRVRSVADTAECQYPER